MRDYLSEAPKLDMTTPNLKQTVTYRNIKNVGLTNSHAIYVNYPVNRLAVTPNKDTKNV
jgi:hypothetical protein